MDPMNETRRLSLEPGQLVILHPDGPAGGFPMVVPVDHFSKGAHWFLGCVDPIRRGENLIVELPIPNDARYATRGKVVASSDSTFALELEPDWERVQQRAFVRISAHGLQVRIVRLGASAASRDAAADDVYDLVDLSAGGIRFDCPDGFETDEEIVCHFELPGSQCFVLPGRIARAPHEPSTVSTKPSTAVEFVGLDENHRSQLLRWVYREQVRRHREEAREEEDAARDSAEGRSRR